MTLLRSITISNVRRFADNVKIDFGEGVTILLAPNGTGKTTVFEAVELALTGTVSRLKNSLRPLIREGMEQARVRLDFNGDIFKLIFDSLISFLPHFAS